MNKDKEKMRNMVFETILELILNCSHQGYYDEAITLLRLLEDYTIPGSVIEELKQK